MTFRSPFLLLIILIQATALTSYAGIKITIQGNAFFGNGKIEDALSAEPENYTEDELREWREDADFNIADLYRESGYFDAQIKTIVTPRAVAQAKEQAREKDPPRPQDGKDWDATITIEEGPRYQFDSIRVLVVAPGAETTREDDFSEDLDSEDSDTLRTQGNIGATSSPMQLAQGNVGDAPAPTQTIALKSVSDSMTSAPRAPDSATQSALVPKEDLAVRSGKPYKESLIFQDRRLLLQRYGDAGYVRAKVDDRVVVNSEAKMVSVDFLVEPSYPVVFDTLVIRNMRATPFDSLQGITRDEILRSLVPYRRGDTVRLSSNDKVIEKLQYAGSFNYVRIKDSLLSGSDHRSALTLYSEEHIPGNVRSALFYETQYGAGVSLDARHSNVAGTLNEVRGGGSLAVDRQSVYAGYGSPLTLGLLVRFDEDLGFNWDQSLVGLSGQGLFGGNFQGLNSMRLTWPAKYWLRLVGDVELEAKSKMLGAGDRQRDLNLNFIQTAFFTFLNQVMDPTRGLRFAVTLGNGGPLEKSGIFDLTEFRHNWIEVQTAQYYYYPRLRQVKFATRVDGGRFFGNGGANSDRFFLGGPRSVRSYAFQNLCPERSEGGVCFGEDEALAYGLVSGELRVDIFDFGFINPRGKLKWMIPVQIVPFIDVGKVWDSNQPFDAGNPLRQNFPPGEGYAMGLGLRYPLLGIFNLRLDFVGGSGPVFFWLDLAQAF